MYNTFYIVNSTLSYYTVNRVILIELDINIIIIITTIIIIIINHHDNYVNTSTYKMPYTQSYTNGYWNSDSNLMYKNSNTYPNVLQV